VTVAVESRLPFSSHTALIPPTAWLLTSHASPDIFVTFSGRILCFKLARTPPSKGSNVLLTLPLPTVKPQAPLLRPKRNLAPLRKEKHIPLSRLHFLPRLVRYFKIPIDNDLNLIVSVIVDKLWAWVETVETGGYGSVGGEVLAV